ncbi:MAG: 4a-hydroxytetrahydrobiopterin dehydratase [Bacteroidota bacterium]
MAWQHTNDQLQRTYTFTDFRRAFAFMTEVAFAAEAAAHHPEWTNVYNRVTIHLTTHDAGNTVTEKDRTLATEIDAIYARYAR